MNNEKPVDEEEPWIIPLHGIEAPGQWKQPPPPVEEVSDTTLFESEELPTIEFRPRLRRSA